MKGQTKPNFFPFPLPDILFLKAFLKEFYTFRECFRKKNQGVNTVRMCQNEKGKLELGIFQSEKDSGGSCP